MKLWFVTFVIPPESHCLMKLMKEAQEEAIQHDISIADCLRPTCVFGYEPACILVCYDTCLDGFEICEGVIVTRDDVVVPQIGNVVKSITPCTFTDAIEPCRKRWGDAGELVVVKMRVAMQQISEILRTACVYQEGEEKEVGVWP